MKKTKGLIFLAIVAVLIAGMVSGCADQAVKANHTYTDQLSRVQPTDPAPTNNNASDVPEPATDNFKVHFLDVGQGESILIQTANHAILVDGGSASASQTVIDYIKSQGINKLDAVIATHPHQDHIGGLVSVIKTFPVERFYMPNKAHTTQTFANLIEAVNQSGAKRIQAKAGVSFEFDDAKAEFLAPNSANYDSLNDYSAVLKITHGQNSFLLTGDAERVSEQEMLDAGYDLKATVLKAGNHGSNTSTTDAFLKAVSPDCAVISCGKDNEYGLPHQEVLSRLAAAGVGICRTDQLGTILATSDGQRVAFHIRPSSVRPDAPPESAASVDKWIPGHCSMSLKIRRSSYDILNTSGDRQLRIFENQKGVPVGTPRL